MKKAIVALGIGLALTLAPCGPTLATFTTPTAEAGEFKARAIEKVMDSILTLNRRAGGVVIDKRHVLTARHAVKEVGNIVRLDDRAGGKYRGEVIWVNDNDLAMIRILDADLPMAPVEVGPLPKLGDPVFVLGYNLQHFEAWNSPYIPKEDKSTLPQVRIGFGHISSVRNMLLYADVGTYGPGGSGGGWFDRKGRLVGITSMYKGDRVGKFGIGRRVDNVDLQTGLYQKEK